MSVKLTCLNYTARPLPAFFKVKVRLVFRAMEKLLACDWGEVNVAMVDEPTIKFLNRSYRHHNRVTDVLSFTYEDNPVTGDIVICMKQAARQAARYGNSKLAELLKLTIHGSLHLLGYDHIKSQDRQVMRKLEQAITKLL
ncbi:MAG: rRNA maturation RNase YbeY [Patescibacteria group bacterium]